MAYTYFVSIPWLFDRHEEYAIRQFDTLYHDAPTLNKSIATAFYNKNFTIEVKFAPAAGLGKSKAWFSKDQAGILQ